MSRTWRLPSLSAALWLAFFLALCLTDWRLVLISADGDACLHWRIGDWMIQHHRVIAVEAFSHTGLGRPLISKEWFGEVAYAAMGNALSWNGAVLLAAALIASTLLLLHRVLLKQGDELLVATGLVLLAAFTMSHHWLARPHLLTHLLTVLYAWQLRAFDRNRTSGVKLACWLVPLMFFWVNAHGAFFTGFVLIALYVVGNLHRPRVALTLSLIGLATLLVSFINPNGWQLHAHIVQFIRDPVLAGYSNEFRSPNFHSGGMNGFLLLLTVLLLMFTGVRPRLRVVDGLLLAAWGFCSLRSVRNIPIFTIVALPILGEHLSQWWRHYREVFGRSMWHSLAERIEARQAASGGLGWVLLAVLGMVGVMWRWNWPPTALLPERFPVAAVAWVKAHPAEVGGNMFNDYGWGGYLMLVLPEHPVFMDGRNDFYGPELMKEFDVVDEVQADWAGVLDKHQVMWTILPIKHPLNQILALTADWEVAHTDSVAIIYRRAGR